MKRASLKELLKIPELTETEMKLQFVDYFSKEMKILRLYPSDLEQYFTKVELPAHLLTELDDLLDKSLTQVNELIDMHHTITGEIYKDFLKWRIGTLINDIVIDEYRMILKLNKFVKSEDFIEGKYLKYNIADLEVVLLDQPVKSLIHLCVNILNPLLRAYKENNSGWLKEYMKFHQTSQKLNQKIEDDEAKKTNPYLFKAKKYFDECRKLNQRPTISGFSRNIGVSRSTLVDKLGYELHKQIKKIFANYKNFNS